jgi:hypothetical protein
MGKLNPGYPIDACHSVMVEVLTILGKHREHLIIVGGWVPPLLFGPGDHIGSLDVDLAVDWRHIPAYAYETIHRELAARHYFQSSEAPNRFVREVPTGDSSFRVKVDLLTGSDGDDADQSKWVHGLPLWCARGVSVALDHHVTATLKGFLPDGSRNELQVQVATAGSLVVMKAIAMSERLKEKDAYDVYYCCRHHPDGVAGLADELRPPKSLPVVAAALRELRIKFGTIDSAGPEWVALVSAEAGHDAELARRDAFERIQELLRLLA